MGALTVHPAASSDKTGMAACHARGRLLCSADNRYAEKSHVFRVGAVLHMEGPLDDPGLVPQVRGITDRLPREWDAPFPLDRTRLKRTDDLFWQQHKLNPALDRTVSRQEESRWVQ